MSTDAKSAAAAEGKTSYARAQFIIVFAGLTLILLVLVALRFLLFQPFIIPSASMEPTLWEGDYIIVSKFDYGYGPYSFPVSLPKSWFSGRIFAHQPKRGDLVVFKRPSDNRSDYVKRLIGLPGDQVQLKQGLVYINGKPVTRKPMPPGTEDMGEGIVRPVQRYQETLPNGVTYLTNSWGNEGDVDNTAVFVVPQGHYFMVGDNRDNSLDSRFPEEMGGGFVPFENLEGHVRTVLFSRARSDGMSR
jgi:signal peptidase I